MPKTEKRYSIGRVTADHWTELLSESRIDAARRTRDSLNRAKVDPKFRIKKITTTKEYVD